MAAKGGIGKLRFLRPLAVTQASENATGPVPPLVTNANFPQIVDVALAAGFALIIPMAHVPSGGPQSSETQFGTHAEATHQAETLKTRVSKSPIAGPGILGNFVSQGQQFYVDWSGEVTASVVSGQAAKGIRSFVGSPENIDLTQQGFIIKPTMNPQGPTVRPFTASPESIDLTLQSKVFKPISTTAVAAPTVTQIFGAPQQIDLTQQGEIYPSLFQQYTASFGPSSYRFGTQAEDTYNAEAQKTEIWKAIQIGGTPPITGPILCKYIIANPERIDLTLQASLSKPLIGTVPNIGPIFKYINSNTEDSVQLTDYILESLASPSPPILGEMTITTPQIEDRPYHKSYKAAWSQPITTGILGSYIETTSQFEERPTRVVYQSVVAGQTPPVIKQIYGSPEYRDLTQQADISSSVWAIPPLAPVVQTIIAAPQFVDLTQQTTFSKPLSGPLPTTYAAKQIYGSPEYRDLTQQAEIFAPPIIGSVAATGSGRAHKEERRGIDWSIPFSFQQAPKVAEEVVKDKSIEVKKLPKQIDLDYYSDLIVALEKKIQYYRNQLEHLKQVEGLKQLERSQKIKNMLAVLNKAKKVQAKVVDQNDDDDDMDDIESIMLIFEMED